MRTGSATTLALAVGLAALALTLAEVATRYVPNTWIQRDGRFYTNVNVTLAERGSVDQSEFAASWYERDLGWNRNLDAGWSNVARGREGERLPKHPLLLPLLSTPFFWAFGLEGTLVFNVLMFVIVATLAFSLARHHGSAAAAAAAALALPLGSGIRDHAYDYHVDVLMLALFVAGMAMLYARRGGWAGLLLGAAVVLRPTALLWMPSLALILLARRDTRTLARTVLTGAAPLLLFAVANTWLYGRPWWSGYNRVLVLVDGQPAIADVGDAFSVPFDEGLEALWSGPYGVRHRLTLAFAAVPGLLLLMRRQPGYVIAACLGVAASTLLFATYRWYGDRFLWPSMALLLPALTVTFDSIGWSWRERPWWRPAMVGALATVVIVLAQSAGSGPLERQLEGGDLEDAALHLLALGALGFGLTRTAERAGAGSLGVLAPIALVLLPGVRERILSGGVDLHFAAAIALALGASSGLVSLLLASVAAWVATRSTGSLEPTVLLAQLGHPGGRAVLGLIALAAVALPVLGRRSFLLVPLAMLAMPRIAGIGADRWPLFAVALLCVPLPALAARLAAPVAWTWRAASPSRRALGIASIAVALFVAGLLHRAVDRPFRIASYEGLRTADVRWGEIPCDFLAWEHMNWECAIHDRGIVHGETGLTSSQPLHVGGRQADLFLISTHGGRPRTVRWHGVRAGPTLVLRWVIPDELRGGGTLTVRVDGRALASIALPPGPDARVHEERIDTRAFAGRDVALELELARAGAVAVDGRFLR